MASYDHIRIQVDPGTTMAEAKEGPVSQSMSDSDSTKLTNEMVSSGYVCPGLLSCFLSTIIPFGWLGSCSQVNTRQELVLLNWGKYLGVLREPGVYWMNPFGMEVRRVSTAIQSIEIPNLKVLDFKGSPLQVSGVVTYQVLNAKKAVLDVENWNKYIVNQAEVVMKQICSSHPYEAKPGEDSLKTETSKVRGEIVQLLQQKGEPAGIRILNFEFKELSYAPEIAPQMLVRQQAEAMLDARKVVVQGAAEIALGAVRNLSDRGVVMSKEETARLASNLIITIVSDSKVTPTISL